MVGEVWSLSRAPLSKTCFLWFYLFNWIWKHPNQTQCHLSSELNCNKLKRAFFSVHAKMRILNVEVTSLRGKQRKRGDPRPVLVVDKPLCMPNNGYIHCLAYTRVYALQTQGEGPLVFSVFPSMTSLLHSEFTSWHEQRKGPFKLVTVELWRQMTLCLIWMFSYLVEQNQRKHVLLRGAL